MKKTALSALAWRCWLGGGAGISCDDSQRADLIPALEAGILIEETEGFRFKNLETLVREAAGYALDEERTALTISGKACFQRLNEFWQQEKLDDHCLAGYLLAALHNHRHIDAYAAAKEALEAGVRVYEVTRILEEAVELLDYAEPASMMGLFLADYGKDRVLVAGAVYSPLERWLVQHPSVARDLKCLHEESPSEKGWGLYACALQGLVRSDFSAGWPLVVDAATNPDPRIAGPAIRIFGFVDYTDPLKAGAAVDAIAMCARIVRAAEPQLVSQAVSVLGRLIPSHELLATPLLEEAARTGQSEVLSAIADVLLSDVKDRWGRPWHWPLVLHLTRLAPEERHVLSTIDMMLNGWLKHSERAPKVVEFLDRWMEQQSSESLREAGPEIAFDSTIHKLVQHRELFGRMLTAWLLHAERRYPHAIHKILGKLNVARVLEFEFASDLLDPLSEQELRFLVRRVLGYLINEDTLLSLIFSLVRSRDAETRTFGFVATVLRDHIGRDYPGATVEFLRKRQGSESESDQVRGLCGSIAGEIEARLAEVDALPDLREFHPSTDKTKRFLKERARQMNDSMEEASGKSIWRQIATQIPLKGGIRTFHNLMGKYSAPMELKPMSHTVSLPFSAIYDPVGTERERLEFRSTPKP